MQANASYFAIRYKLAQEENQQLFPVHYGGRVLSPTERELPAIFYSVKKEVVYLKGNDSIFYIDHEPLTRLQAGKETINKIHCWIEFLQELGTIIQYLPGKANVVANFITRNLKPERKLDILHCCSLHF